jgi:hypothetical protein
MLTIKKLIADDLVDKVDLSDGSFILRSKQSISLRLRIQQLEVDVQPTLHGLHQNPVVLPSLELFLGNSRDVSKKIAVLEVAKTILELGYIRYGDCAEMLLSFRNRFINFTNRSCRWELPLVECENSCRALEIFLYLPVIKVPFRCHGQRGTDPGVLLPNVSGIQNEDLPVHIKPIISMLAYNDSRAAAGTPLQVEEFHLLKNALPAVASSLVDFFIVKVGLSIFLVAM